MSSRIDLFTTFTNLIEVESPSETVVGFSVVENVRPGVHLPIRVRTDQKEKIHTPTSGTLHMTIHRSYLVWKNSDGDLEWGIDSKPTVVV